MPAQPLGRSSLIEPWPQIPFRLRNTPIQNLGKPGIPPPGITRPERGVARMMLNSMASYRLRRVLRSTNGKAALSFDSRTIEAADLEAAITAARGDTRVRVGQEVESAILSTQSGEIVWTSAAASQAPGSRPGI
jgi:hypothetical protein